jgi:DNA-binding FadR family transcriptional regulator
MGNDRRSFIPPSARDPGVQGAQLIARELQACIKSGFYAYHQQLPTERELALAYRASRTTIRKALMLLEEQKLVERRRGSGTYASFEANDTGRAIAEQTSPLELIEVCAAIEPQIARLAVHHASGRDLKTLQSLLNELLDAERQRDPVRYSQSDERFHLAIASSTSNPLLIWLYKKIANIRAHALSAEMQPKLVNAEDMHARNQQHTAIFRAIQARDVAVAAETMTQHVKKDFALSASTSGRSGGRASRRDVR